VIERRIIQFYADDSRIRYASPDLRGELPGLDRRRHTARLIDVTAAPLISSAAPR
jgi:hypothetical protein